MEISALQRQAKASELPLEKLAGSSHIPDAEKIVEVCRQFESMLLRQILGDAQKTVLPSKLNPQSFSSGIYQDLMSEQLADKISRSGGFGLARYLEKQLGHELKPGARGSEARPEMP